ncbi:MAG: succinylglutamate-semialdehyde dehydrogenase [Sphingomonadaceae bacterium]
MSPSETLRSFCPHDGALLWEGPVAGEAAVAEAVARARAAASGWAATPLAERIAVAERFAERVRAAAEGFARTIAQETGKPFWEAQGEVASVAAKVAISVEAYAARTGSSSRALAADPATTQAVRHKPHGVLAVLGPYNFPAHLPNGHIVPALIAGNTIVFKPSELTPATAEAMHSLWREAGLPPGVLQLVQGGAQTGRALAAADVDGLLFTGSAPTGLALARQFAETPWKILALEMGGNNPLVAWDLADDALDAAALVILQSAFLSAGQRCTCARRLIVQEGREGPLLARVLALAARMRIGAPFADPPPFMGPLIDNRAADRVLAMADALKGRWLTGPPRRLHDGLPFLAPAILDATGAYNPDEEIFGPVLQVIRVADFEAAIFAANATRFGLAASLLGGDRALYDRFWAQTRAGVVNWNRPTNGAASSAPFGGVGLSGNHRPSAFYAADYCAFPVASLEGEAPHAPLVTGLN